ncbi:MAG: ribonuclease P [Nanoarchaeota archaeon]|nr:ribonuclease P [Nanoarchaeota archaeon]MBU1643954.1 ribonuclease P [Nanoarchaeota archaeon]MBU1977391.1 ribonuclease P [Nanoarchaeota archaeon]
MSRPLVPKQKQKEIALQRIKTLFEEAENNFSKNKALSNRYVALARKIAMKVKIRIPLDLKRRFCKHCYKYLMPGVNSRVRTREGKVIISCFECKKFTRIPTIKKLTKRAFMKP